MLPEPTYRELTMTNTASPSQDHPAQPRQPSRAQRRRLQAQQRAGQRLCQRAATAGYGEPLVSSAMIKGAASLKARGLFTQREHDYVVRTAKALAQQASGSR